MNLHAYKQGYLEKLAEDSLSIGIPDDLDKGSIKDRLKVFVTKYQGSLIRVIQAIIGKKDDKPE